MRLIWLARSFNESAYWALDFAWPTVHRFCDYTGTWQTGGVSESGQNLKCHLILGKGITISGLAFKLCKHQPSGIATASTRQIYCVWKHILCQWHLDLIELYPLFKSLESWIFLKELILKVSVNALKVRGDILSLLYLQTCDHACKLLLSDIDLGLYSLTFLFLEFSYSKRFLRIFFESWEIF